LDFGREQGGERTAFCALSFACSLDSAGLFTRRINAVAVADAGMGTGAGASMGVGVGVGMGVGVGWAEVAAAAAVVVRPEEVPVIEAVQATLAVEVTAIYTHLPHRQSPCGDVSRVRRPRERLCRRAT
jgi:hypothetical protein